MMIHHARRVLDLQQRLDDTSARGDFGETDVVVEVPSSCPRAVFAVILESSARIAPLESFITIGIGRPGPKVRPMTFKITGAWLRLYSARSIMRSVEVMILGSMPDSAMIVS